MIIKILRIFFVPLLSAALVASICMNSVYQRQTRCALEMYQTNKFTWEATGYAAAIEGFKIGIEHPDKAGFLAFKQSLDRAFPDVQADVTFYDRVRPPQLEMHKTSTGTWQ